MNDSIEVDIKQIALSSGAAPTASDMWLAMIFISVQLQYGFKWYLFALVVLLFGVEKVLLVVSVNKFLKWKKVQY